MSNTLSKAACGFAILTLAACVGPLGDQHYMELNVPDERVRTIDTLNLEEESRKDEGKVLGELPATLELSIEEVRALAIQNNLEMEAALMDPTIARQAIDEERGRFEALFFGNVTQVKTDTPTSTLLSGSQSENLSAQAGVRLPLTTGGTLTAAVPIARSQTDLSFATLNPAYEADFEFSISQPLLRNAGPRTNTHFIRIARYDVMGTDATTKLKVMRILADIDRLYWRLYGARRDLEVRKQQYDLAERQLERAKRQVQVGKASEIEVTRAESGVSEGLEGIIVAEGVVQDRERELKRAINKPGLTIESLTHIVPTTPPNPMIYTLDGPRLAERALQQRMEMLQLEIRLVQDASTIAFQRNQALPLLNLDYTYGVNGLGRSFEDAFDLAMERDFEDHVIAARMEVPLGNQTAKARVRRAIYTRIQRLATRKQQELLIREEVINAVGSINTIWQRIQAAQRRTILAQRTFEGEQRQFDQGLRTSTDVLEAQYKLADAQLAEVHAIADYEIAQVDLAVATGTLLGATQVRWEPLEPAVK